MKIQFYFLPFLLLPFTASAASIEVVSSVISGNLTSNGNGHYTSDWFGSFGTDNWPIIDHEWFGAIEIESNSPTNNTVYITDSELGLIITFPGSNTGSGIYFYKDGDMDGSYETNYLVESSNVSHEEGTRWLFKTDQTTSEWVLHDLSSVSDSPELSTYTLWIEGFPSVGAAAGFNQDADLDGVPNGIEHVYATDPSDASDAASVSELSASSGNLSFRHRLTETIADDVTANYEWSLDLVHWNASGTTANSTTVTINRTTFDANPAGYDIVEATATVSGTPKRVFIRMDASLIP